MIDHEDLHRVHEAALRLLGSVGCDIFDADALALLASRGAVVDGSRARLSEELISEAVATVPPAYCVVGRRPNLELRVALDAPPVFASAAGAPFVLHGREQRHGTVDDLRTAIALAHMSPNVDVVGYSVEPMDVADERRARISAYAHATGSDKAARFAVTSMAELQVACDVNEILFGADWHERPRLWSIVNTTSPLQMSAEAAQALIRLARLGQPICVTACAMGGTTAPLTPAGLLAVQHAELLMGLALTQVAQPGCPFLYGGTSSVSSMRSGALLMGAPDYWALTEATVQLGHWLGLPVRAGAAVTDANLPDAQAGAESALAMEAVLRMDVQFVLHAGGILSSFNCFSPEKFVIDDEVLGALRLAKRPLIVDDETLALDAVAAVGPGGTFLGQAHTRRHARRVQRPTVMSRDPYAAWRSSGGRDLSEAAAGRVAELVAGYSPPDDLDHVVRRQLEAYCLA